MSFARVCGVVTCAVVAAAGCGVDRDAQGTPNGSPADQAAEAAAPAAADLAIADPDGGRASVELLGHPGRSVEDSLTVTGYSQAAHGRVTLVGGRATYVRQDGYTGADRFSYTISNTRGKTTTRSVVISACEPDPVCTIAMTGPASGVIGTPIRLQATAHCNTGTPEIQWSQRVGTHAFSAYQAFGAPTAADYPTLGQATGNHQFQAKVRARGFATTYTSNTLTIPLSATVGAPCTAASLDTPGPGLVSALRALISLHATATCPAGAAPEFAYQARSAPTA
ncbi:MAG TPA: Ig-like domain-containing protein, partial [Kofleriaceae bacterium]